MPAKEKIINWSIFIILSFIWGSSFILMKEGMKDLSDYQVASIRMLSAGLVLAPVALRKMQGLTIRQAGFIFLSGLLGSFVPAYLYCIAETKIDSSLAAFINAFTPIFTILIGIFLFSNTLGRRKIPGVIAGFAGILILFLAKNSGNAGQMGYGALVIIATLSYALNVNMVQQYLKNIPSVTIVANALTMLIIPSLFILAITGFFQLPFTNRGILLAITASTVLGVLGTAVGTILFYMLLKRAGPVFSSMVTYGIPFVALFWGLIAGEQVNTAQLAGLGILLVGVYMAGK